MPNHLNYEDIVVRNHFEVCCSPFSADFPSSPKSLDGDQKIQTYHHFIEAAKFTNGQKKSINDPIFNDIKVGF